MGWREKQAGEEPTLRALHEGEVEHECVVRAPDLGDVREAPLRDVVVGLDLDLLRLGRVHALIYSERMPEEVLFCPFCREAFEGEKVCPDHELALVPFEALPQSRGADLPRDDAVVAPYDPRFGRWILFVAVVVMLVGFMMPFATTSMDGESLTLTGIEIAARRPILWAVPFVAGSMIVILALRRTPREMRGARVAIPMLALLGLGAVAFGVHVVRGFAADRLSRYGVEMDVGLEPGIYVMALGLFVAVVGGVRLGVLPRREHLPHGATVEGEDGHIVVREDD